MVKEQKKTGVAQKKGAIVLCSLTVWVILVFIVIWPWIHKFDDMDLTLSVLAHISAAIWWIVLLWALHHLAFQLAVFFREKAGKERSGSDLPEIAVLYATCDDFSPDSCQSVLDQDYEKFQVYVCDDSTQSSYKESVREFCSVNSRRCSLVTRSDRQGFKGGNLNNAIAHNVKQEWILLVDADQVLPRDYLSKFVRKLPVENSRIAFVQAGHEALIDQKSSPFQAAMAPEVSLYYFHDLTLRESYGFVPMVGHGAMIRRSAWEAIGGFPGVVSEDFAFALGVANKKLRGIYVEDVVGYEAFPYDFSGFMIRMRKFAGGTAELLRKSVVQFLRGPAFLVEKWDFMLMLLWYVIMPFVTLNGFLGAFVVNKVWRAGFPYIHPVLPYLYSWMLFVIVVLHLSTANGFRKALRFYFWSTSIYTAAMPLVGLSFVKHLFSRAIFERTPKNQVEGKLGLATSSLMVVLGSAATICSLLWTSPFSPFLAGQGIAYLSYPLYGKLCSHSFSGKLARVVIYVPGLLMLSALYAMWRWGGV